MTQAVAPQPTPRGRGWATVRAALKHQARWLRRVYGLGAALLVLWATVEAVTPRPDWHAPIEIFPLRWRFSIAGTGFSDKLQHLGLGTAVTLLVCVALGHSAQARTERRFMAALAGWMASIELVQGFLPYRNAELLDCGAGLLGAALGLVVIRCARWRPAVRRAC